MRSEVKNLRAAWLLVGLACALPGAAAGEARRNDGPERWVPALAVFGAGLTQQAEGTAHGALGPEASGDRFGEPGASQEGEHWVPAVAVIVALLEGEGSAPGPSPPGGDLPLRPADGDAAEVTTIVLAPVGDSPAAGEPEPKDEVERWVPAVAVWNGVLVRGAEGDVSTSPDLTGLIDAQSLLKCAGDPQGQRDKPSHPFVRCPVSGDDLMVGALVGGSVELMTPGLRSVPGWPRVFLHGDAAVAFPFDRSLGREGSPGEMQDRIRSGGTPEVGIEGQGSELSVTLRPLVVSAGLGVAFTVPVGERRLRIKPSFEYLREQIDISGVVNRAVRSVAGRANVTPAEPSEFVFIEMRGSQRATFDGIGPGLEVEVDTARAGPFVLTLFLSGRAYKILSDRKVTLADSFEIVDEPPLPDQTVNASWTFTKDPWSYRAGVGLRFRWLPE